MPCVFGIDYTKTTDFLGIGLLFLVDGEIIWRPFSWYCSESADLGRIKFPLDEACERGDLAKVEGPEIPPDVIVAGSFRNGGIIMKNTVTKQQIDELLAKSEIKVETVYDKVTVVNCKLPNGFVITESSGAVDSENYDEEIGKEICMSQIENKLWELEGYALTKKLCESEE